MQLTLFLTNQCNINCVYCYQHLKNANTMSFECATQWIDKYLITSNEKVNIYLFGGEPFLQFPLIKKICEWTWSKKWPVDYQFVIQTNGTLFNPDIKGWLSKNKEKIVLCLSLDGNKMGHDKSRSDSFDMIDFDFLKNTWPSTPIKMTISKANVSFLFQSVIWIHKMGFRFSGCNVALGEGDFQESFFKTLEEQLFLLAQHYLSHPFLKPAPIINANINRLGMGNIKDYISCHIETEKLVVVNTDGTISACSFFSNISLTEANRRKINNELKDLSMRKLFCYNNCELFNACDICYAENYSDTGNIYIPSPSRCKLMKIRILASMYLQAHKIYKKELSKITPDDIKISQIVLNYYPQIREFYPFSSLEIEEDILAHLSNIILHFSSSSKHG